MVKLHAALSCGDRPRALQAGDRGLFRAAAEGQEIVAEENRPGLGEAFAAHQYGTAGTVGATQGGFVEQLNGISTLALTFCPLPQERKVPHSKRFAQLEDAQLFKIPLASLDFIWKPFSTD
jgi:hypothetical protein